VVSRYDWLLALHVTGAFMVLSGVAMAGIFNVTAMRRERPSEVALLFRLTQIAAGLITTGLLVTLALGLWLVSDADYGYGETWVVLALILWFVAGALGGVGGGREKATRQLAERLAAEGDAPSDELRARLRDPVSLALSWGAGLVVIVILVLMIWKPGA
jgi:uncharacterized membrane protein